MQTFAEMKTSGGYKCDEVTSALQKSIRRGLEEQALFWGTELDISGFGEYVWKRLKIIASEDVGIADNQACLTISTLYQSWRELRAKKKSGGRASERLFLIHAIIYLADAKKSRVVDHAGIAMYEAPRPHMEIPDFALDRHSGAGRALHRGWEHFWNEGAKLSNRAPDLYDPYEETAKGVRQDKPQEQPAEEVSDFAFEKGWGDGRIGRFVNLPAPTPEEMRAAAAGADT